MSFGITFSITCYSNGQKKKRKQKSMFCFVLFKYDCKKKSSIWMSRRGDEEWVSQKVKRSETSKGAVQRSQRDLAKGFANHQHTPLSQTLLSLPFSLFSLFLNKLYLTNSRTALSSTPIFHLPATSKCNKLQ